MSWHKTSELLVWLGEWRRLYFSSIPVLLAPALIWILSASEPSIRLTGLTLQILGIFTVIWGISTTRKQFGHPPVMELVLSWLRRFPLIKHQPSIQPEGISVGATILGGRLTSVFAPNPTASLEDRLSHIEKGMETLQNRILNTESQIDNQSGLAHGRAQLEKRARELADKEIMNALESSSTGGIHISAIGAAWLFSGVILSTASLEISAWLK